MLQEAIDLQQSAVSRLVEELKTKKEEITFKAPTGSGKTYMMADLMNRVLTESQNTVFIVSSLSKGDLAGQNYEKFDEYKEKGRFPNLDAYMINTDIAGEERLYIPTDHNVYVLPRDLYKKGGRLMQGAMNAFLEEVRWTKNKSIILIKDECHIATKNLDTLAQYYFHRTINVSATPQLKRGQHPDVEITKEDAENARLIKTIEWGSEDKSVADAISKFEEIREEYRNLLDVNPCLIIQISNKDKADEELKNKIFPALDAKPDLKWMLIVDNDKSCDTNDVFKSKKLPVSKWKNYAKERKSLIDIIIFKMVISEGWDIPRACMLYQVRDSQSKQLDEQVMGRVRRNPRLLDFELLDEKAQQLAMTAWVWGVKPEDEQGKAHIIELWDKEATTENVKIKITKLKDLTEKADFVLEEFLAKQKKPTVHTSIFNLSRQLNKSDNDVRDLIYEYATDISKWWEAAEFVKEISAENDKYRCDYAQSMEVENGEFSFPTSSHYFDNVHYLNISNGVWKRRDGAEKFSFDSEAERDWAEILRDLSQSAAMSVIAGRSKDGTVQTKLFEGVWDGKEVKEKEIFLWGKNHIPNSAIKFQYYMNALHSSYPDFVLIDRYSRVHIFEVKSVNVSGKYTFDNNIYLAKIERLSECYKQASIITNQIFYMPILEGDIWKIIRFNRGQEDTLTKEQFISFVKSSS